MLLLILDISWVDFRFLELVRSIWECIELIYSSGYVIFRDVYFMEILLKVINSFYFSLNFSLYEDIDYEGK